MTTIENEPHLPEPLLAHIDWRYHNGVNQGWWPLVEEMHERFTRIDPDYRAHQIKQKMGLLTVYVDDQYHDLPEIREALETAYPEFRRRLEAVNQRTQPSRRKTVPLPSR
jgi:hypothetical protein